MTNYLKILFVIVCFVIVQNSIAQELDNAIDQIPRDRLVTDAELLKLIDTDLVNKADRANLESFANYLRNRKSPKYFFAGAEVKEQTKLFLEKFPEEKTRIDSKVDEFQTAYGNNIDWLLPSKDLVGRWLTPNSIRYVARFPLAYEYAMSAIINDDKTPIDNLIAQLKDFVSDYENGEVESAENDVFERFYAGHRTRNLLFAHNLLLASKYYSVSQQIFIIKVFLLQGAKLIDTCEKFHWGNHQLHGLAGLYEMSIMYPEFPVMRYWNKLAQKTIMEHITKEIKSDGFQFERASHYYKLDIMNYFRIYKISKINNVSLPEPYEQRFKSMFDAFVSLALPSKSLPVLQDAQNKYKSQLGNMSNNDAAELSDPKESLYLSLGAQVFNNEIYKYFGSSTIPAEVFWFFSKEDREEYEKISAQKPKIGSIALEESKYYVMRTGWENDSYYLLVDGGLAEYKPDHTHGGILGIFANAFGKNILPTYRVRYSSPTYRYLKNSFAKNVALADNVVQGHNWKSNNARTGFGNWQELPQPKVNDWVTSENFDYFSGTHNAFEENGVKYNRSILFFKPNFWLVIDDYKSKSMHSYQQLWQGDFETLDNVNGIVKKIDGNSFYIIQADYSNMRMEDYSKYGYKSFKFEKVGVKNYSFSTILYPLKGVNNVEPKVLEFERNDYKQISVQNGTDKGVYFMNKGEVLSLDEINTDAKYIFATYKNDVLKSFLVYKGSYCSLEGYRVEVKKKSVIEVKIMDDNKLVYKIIK